MANTTVTTLIANMKTEIESAISFTELPYYYELNNNAKIKANDRYLIIPLDSAQIEGVNRYYTMDQTFQITLVDKFTSSSMNDDSKQSVTNSLYNKCYDIYTALVQSKAGTPAVVMNLKDLSIAEPEFIDEKDFVVINMGFIITYRQAI